MFAVTTGLPAARAAVISSRAGSMPPMTSTTRSMSGSVDDVVGVAGQHAGVELDATLPRQVAHGDAGDLEGDAGAGLDLLRLLGDEADERRPDVAAPEDPDADELCHGGSGYGLRSPKLMPMSRAVRISSQSSGTDLSRLVASASGT